MQARAERKVSPCRISVKMMRPQNICVIGKIGMKTPRFLLVLLTVFLVMGCDSNLAQKDSESHDYLIVLPNSENIKKREIDGTFHILYNLQAKYPASNAIAFIENQLKSLALKQIKHDALNFNAPTSVVTGWTISKEQARGKGYEAHIWYSVWKNDAGDYVKYHFQYLTPMDQIAEQDALMVAAIFVPAKKAKEILDQVKDTLEKNK